MALENRKIALIGFSAYDIKEMGFFPAGDFAVIRNSEDVMGREFSGIIVHRYGLYAMNSNVNELFELVKQRIR